ncbi:3-keto-disaccharide hydrolase [Flagellimonas sp.]|uniref:3-keto-disaccharide hydrolase n=1 Tax=Flagellimonas sp. TaxID=2058762 RepID=UPI003B5033E6
MNKSIVFVSTLLMGALIIFNVGCKREKISEISLFEENSDAWFVDGDSKWEFVNNELMGIADSTSGFIITHDKYRNFELSLEFQPDSTINSGVFVQCARTEMSAEDCHELNIWDLHPNQDFRTGSIVTKVKPYEIVETLNKWNTYKAVTDEGNIKVYVNDALTSSIEKDTLMEGHIGLQAMGKGTIKFRKVRLKKM